MTGTDERLAGVRVCLVLGSSTGGIGRHVRTLADALVDARAGVTVAGPAETLARFGYAAAGMRAVAAGGPTGLPYLRAAVEGARVVHAHGVTAGLLAGLAGSLAVPYVVTWHNIPQGNIPQGRVPQGRVALPGGGRLGAAASRRAAAAVERYVARRATVNLCVSGDLVRRVTTLGGAARLAPAGAAPLTAPLRSAEQVRAHLGAGNRALIVCVARLAPQKGLDLLVDASGLLARHPRRPLVVVAGEGPLRGRLAGHVAATGAPVRLLGARADVPDLLAAADIAVLSSHWEGSPLAAHEALQAGCPLVATAVGGVPALLGGGAALLVPPGDPAALARALAGLLDDPAAAAALARRGRDRAREWPGAATTAAGVLDVYAELLG